MNRDVAGVKDTGSERTINSCRLEYGPKMGDIASAARGDERDLGNVADERELFYIIALPNPVLVHAVEYNFASPAILCFANPVQRSPLRATGLVWITRVLKHVVIIVFLSAVDTDDYALRAEPLCELRDERRTIQSRGIHRNLVRALVEHILGVCNALYTAGDAEWNIDDSSHVTHPCAIHATAFWARGNIVKHEFIGAFFAVTFCKLHDVAHDAMITELNAFDDNAVADVEAGDYTFRRNDATSWSESLPSSRARPVIAAGTPAASRALRSSTFRTPPEAWSSSSG